MADDLTITRIDKTLERLVRKRMGDGQTVSVRIDDGPPRRGLLYRAQKPFAPVVCELKTPAGKRFAIQVSCLNDGYVIVTWGEATT